MSAFSFGVLLVFCFENLIFRSVVVDCSDAQHVNRISSCKIHREPVVNSIGFFIFIKLEILEPCIQSLPRLGLVFKVLAFSFAFCLCLVLILDFEVSGGRL